MEDYLNERKKEMLSLLELLVNIDSGSSYKEGVDRVGGVLKSVYEKLNFIVEVVEEKEVGNHYILQHKDAIDPEILVVAHMDTVFPKGTAKERPFKIDGNRAFGPGVIDMKASQVSLLYAIKSLINKQLGGYKNIQIILNSDEEIGSPTSREIIEKNAVKRKYALIMEPAREDGSLVTARRGGGTYTIHVKGKAAHSGIEPEKGKSAIEELGYKIVKIHELSDLENGISVNFGIIEGGSSANTVAADATAQIDIRISYMEQAAILDKKIRKICAVPDIEGTEIMIEGGIDRPPMEKSEQTIQLLEVAKAVGVEMGLTIIDSATGGGSDASFTASLGIPTIDGLGPVGGNVHREDEYLEVGTLVERTCLLAMVIQRLTEEGIGRINAYDYPKHL